MEAEELRKLRIAHGLTPRELADLLNVAPEEVLCWEAPEGSPHHKQIDAESRRRILRHLAIFRDHQKQRQLIIAACASPKRFSAQPFVPSLTRKILERVA
jgi:transcriptional regulator with XRE-family HTH domain